MYIYIPLLIINYLFATKIQNLHYKYVFKLFFGIPTRGCNKIFRCKFAITVQ